MHCIQGSPYLLKGSDGWYWEDIVGISRYMRTGAITQFGAINVMLHWVKRTIINEIVRSKMVYIYCTVSDTDWLGVFFPGWIFLFTTLLSMCGWNICHHQKTLLCLALSHVMQKSIQVSSESNTSILIKSLIYLLWIKFVSVSKSGNGSDVLCCQLIMQEWSFLTDSYNVCHLLMGWVLSARIANVVTNCLTWSIRQYPFIFWQLCGSVWWVNNAVVVSDGLLMLWYCLMGR